MQSWFFTAWPAFLDHCALVNTYWLLIGRAMVPHDWLNFDIQYLGPQTSKSKSDRSMWSLLSPPIGQLILAPDWSSQGDSWLVKILNQISQPTDLQIKIWNVITGDPHKSPIPHSSLKRNLNNWFKSFADPKVFRYFCTELYLFVFHITFRLILPHFNWKILAVKKLKLYMRNDLTVSR